MVYDKGILYMLFSGLMQWERAYLRVKWADCSPITAWHGH